MKNTEDKKPLNEKNLFSFFKKDNKKDTDDILNEIKEKSGLKKDYNEDDHLAENKNDYEITGDQSDLDELSNFVDNLEKKKRASVDENGDDNSLKDEFKIEPSKEIKSEKSFIEKVGDQITEIEEFEDKENKMKAPSKLINLMMPLILKIKLLTNDFYGKLPEPVANILRNEHNVLGIMGVTLLLFSYLLIYSPFKEYQLKNLQFKRESEKNKALNSKLEKVKDLLKDRKEASVKNEKKFNELKNSFIFNQFDDSLSVSEYLQELIEKYKLQVKSIGESEIVKSNNGKKNTTVNTVNKDSKDNKANKESELPDAGFPIGEVKVKYDLSGNYSDIEKFLVEIENGRVFMETKNTPVSFKLLPNEQLDFNFNVLAFLDLNSYKNQNNGESKFEKNDVSLKKMVFNRNGSENIRKTFKSTKIYKLNNGYFAILQLVNNKTLILKNGATFQEGNEKYSVEIERDTLKIYNLENDESLELKNEVQVMKND